MQNETGLALRLARIAVGKTQWQIAAKIGVHPSLLNLIESGKRAPEAKEVRARNARRVERESTQLAACRADAERSAQDCGRNEPVTIPRFPVSRLMYAR